MIASSTMICKRCVKRSQRLNRACLTDDGSTSPSQAWGVSGQMVNTARWRETLITSLFTSLASTFELP
jgi:hypothetical protein